MKEQIRNFIIDKLMYGEGTLNYDEPLFDSGKIDSLGFIKILSFIDKQFKVKIEMSEVTMDKFATIDKIVKTIESKSKGS